MRTINIRRAFRLALFFFIFLLKACSCSMDIRYIGHVAKGEAKILMHCTPITEVLADPETSPKLKENLEKVQQIREFAVRELGLPATKSYLDYVDTGRQYVQWSLTATPEFSVTPEAWCFPIAGCSSYLVFYDEKLALVYRNKLKKKGYDVSVRGVSAYSTAGWFNDPVLNTYFFLPDNKLALDIFHEMGHEKLRAKNDTAFSEAFAEFVGETGEVLWARKNYGEKSVQKIMEERERMKAIDTLVGKTRHELIALYRTKLPTEEIRRQKAAIFQQMKQEYAELRKTWNEYNGYDNWMNSPWNNARIAHHNEYTGMAPLFQKIYDHCGQQLECFYTKAGELAELPKENRDLAIQKILE